MLSGRISWSPMSLSLVPRPNHKDPTSPFLTLSYSDDVRRSSFPSCWLKQQQQKPTKNVTNNVVSLQKMRKNPLPPSATSSPQEPFSLHELFKRDVKADPQEAMRESLRGMRQPGMKGGEKGLTESLARLETSGEGKTGKNSSTTPTFMPRPPRKNLFGKHFRPDNNMSPPEKLKLELAKVREEFKISESDCGSAGVQVAQLTMKIRHLSPLLHKKDYQSRRGLLTMVHERKKLLKYLRRTDWDSYCSVVDKLGLRDKSIQKHQTRQ